MSQTAAPGPSNGARDDAHSPARSGKRGGKASASSNKKGDPSVPAGSSVVFQCCGFGDCRMVFTRSEHLARHVRKHTGERPFQCHCQKSFSRLDNLRQHCQTVHSDVPERNEEMLRRLTAVHADLAADAAKHQRMYARVVHHTDLNADKSGSDSKSGGQSRGRRAAAAAAAATNAASSPNAAPSSASPSSGGSASPAPKRARHSPREPAASAAPATSPPEAHNLRLPSLNSINETERTQGWSSKAGTATKTEDLSPKSTESHWASPESYYVSSPQPAASAMPRSRYTWRPPAQLPRSASMSWAHVYPPRAPPALGRSAGSSRSLPCPTADPRAQWYMPPHSRPAYWRTPGAQAQSSPYSVPRAASEREAATPPAPSPPSVPGMPSRFMGKSGAEQNPAPGAPLPPLVALDRLRQDVTRPARPGPAPLGARGCRSTAYGPMPPQSSAPYGGAPDAYEPLHYRRHRWSIAGGEIHHSAGMAAGAKGAALDEHDAGSYYTPAYFARKRKDYEMA